MKNKIIKKLKHILNNINEEDLIYVNNYVQKNIENEINKYIKIEKSKKNIISKLNHLSEKIYNSYFSFTYYNITTNMYFEYKDMKYIQITESDLLYDIKEKIYLNIDKEDEILLKNIENIRNFIIKKIKDNKVYDVIPDTEPIQYILSYLTPYMFKYRLESKLFLVLIGDIILRKNVEHIYFIQNSNNSFKLFCDKINKFINIYFHVSCLSNNIRFKYFNHDKKKSRLLEINSNIYDMFLHNDEFILNLLFISIYHSNKYDSVNNYIKNILNEPEEEEVCIKVKEYICLLENMKETNIIRNFWKRHIVTKDNYYIKDNDMIFLWKKYLKDRNLPSLLYFKQGILENICKLCDKKGINYEKKEDKIIYFNISSLNLPYIKIFLDYWENNKIEDNNEKYLEIEEIISDFKRNKKNNKMLINKDLIKDILQHYYPQIEILKKKFINGYRIKCLDKKMLIEEYIKNNKIISYNNYCVYSKKNKRSIVSKQYYDDYLINKK